MVDKDATCAQSIKGPNEEQGITIWILPIFSALKHRWVKPYCQIGPPQNKTLIGQFYKFEAALGELERSTETGSVVFFSSPDSSE